MQEVRPAGQDDLQKISLIEKECFDTPWSEKMLQESFTAGAYYVVIEADGDIAGYGGLYPNGDITDIAVLSRYREQGFGGRILDELIRYAKDRGIDRIFLEVRTGNLAALKLYKSKGFERIDIRKRYYGDGEDAEIYLLEVN